MESQRSVYAGGRPKIAMPGENEVYPIERLTQQDHYQDSSQPPTQEQSPFPPVPDTVPGEYLAETNDDQPEQTEAEEVETVQAAPQKESSVSANMRALREAREKAERERDEMMRHVMQMQAQMQQNQKQEVHHHEPEPDVEDFADLDPDALVDGKYLNKLAKQQKQHRKEMQTLKEELYKQRTQSSEALVESRIKTQFPDFDKVVSKENVEVLNESYPELARTLRDTTDTYAKAVSAYKVIKQFGIHQEPAPIDHDRVRAMKNAAKPRPLASVNPQQGDSPMSKANAFANGEFTKEMRENSWKEMQAAMKNNR